MRIEQTLNDGLKRAFAVTIPAATIDAKLESQIADAATKIRMPGFRPGKVPLNLVRKMHGEALRGQVAEEAINEGAQKVLTDNKLRPALQPKIDLKGFEPGKDLEFSVELEILPDIAAPALDGLSFDKLVVPVAEAQIDEQVEKIAGQQKQFEAAPKTAKAKSGDALTIDFVGTIDGVEFAGGKGEGVHLELGSGMFIPGFEEQLDGVKAGDQKTVTVTFPANYPSETTRGKDAAFAVTVQEVKHAKPVSIDEDFAKNLGLESLEQLRGLIKAQIAREHDGLSRTHLKRKLLDRLAADHVFEVPASMVEAEFEQIWRQLEQEVGDDAEAKASLEAEKGDYRNIAERRVRLGLLLSEIGQANSIQITQAEMNNLVNQEASRYPGQEKQVVKFFTENAGAAAQLRAPLYEEKVVDFILGKASLTEIETTLEALQAAIEAEDSAAPVTEAKPKKAKTAKKNDEETASTDAEKPAKKAAAKKPKADKEA
jgi:trigger factor